MPVYHNRRTHSLRGIPQQQSQPRLTSLHPGSGSSALSSELEICSHIQDCDLLEDFPVDLSQHWAVFSQDLVTHPSLVGTNYSIMDSLLNHTKHDLFDQTLMYLLTKLVTRTRRGLVLRCKGSSPDVSSDSDLDNPPEAAPVIPAKQKGECTPTPRAKLCRVMLDAQIADEPAQPAPNTPPPLIESTTATVATTPVVPHNPEPVLTAT
ncbi:hypothetical protein DSO57_1032377 [Entomophthora muscae]|uniref:Uncharacterized protein n=1 Tax=Entomophthora muscae TaxID=34485 RepID=A0ACC2RF56_9FUNG|nr:hypothetical protein DSO57_1032377 [Entomophthora muscae]